MKKRRKRKKSLIIVPIASMGDIAFLLIIFFMVASRISRERHQIKPPRSLDIHESINAQITVTIDAGGACFLQGKKLYDVDALESQMEMLLKGRTTDEQRTVIFRCDKSVPNETFEPAIDAIVKAGGLLGLVGKEGEPVGAEE